MVSINNHITSLLDIATTIGIDPLEVLWDDNVFGRNSDVSLYIDMTNVLEFVFGNHVFNISIIQFL